MIKHTTSRLGDTITITSIGFSDGVKVIFIVEASIILVAKISMSSGSDYNIVSDVEIGKDNNSNDIIVCLIILWAIIIGLVFS